MENIGKNFSQIWEYSNCSLYVSQYLMNQFAIAIAIIDNETREIVAKCTTYIDDVNYKLGMATIKNYSENAGMTEFLQQIGVVTKIIESYKCNELADDTETVDICKIDLEKLKEYATEWHYLERKEKKNE